MKMPSKKELLELQRRYRTDKKIGEALGGVEPYLVAYWRRKKGIPAYSTSKYSRGQILEVWERYGNDRLSGNALGISGNAFRYWRKKYSILEKPARLKLEQIQIPLPGINDFSAGSVHQSIIEKIILNKSGKETESENGFKLNPDRIFIRDVSSDFLKNFSQQLNSDNANQENLYILSSNLVPAEECRKALGYIRKQAKSVDPSEGGYIYGSICRGEILPGELAVASDPAIIGSGAVGALGIQLSSGQITEAVLRGAFIHSKTDVVKIVLQDTPLRIIQPLDIVLNLKRELNTDNLAGKFLEYSGNFLNKLDLERRFLLCYLSRFLDCVSVCIQCSGDIINLLRRKAIVKFKPLQSDPESVYSETITRPALEIKPSLCVQRNGQITIEDVHSDNEKKIESVIIGYYSGGMYRDIAEVDNILTNFKKSPKIRVLIQPATKEILLRLEEEGIFRRLVLAGCSILPTSADHAQVIPQNMDSNIGAAMVTDPSALTMFPENYPYPIYLANHLIAASSACKGFVDDSLV